MNDGTLYGHLQYQSNKHKSAFLTSAMAVIDWSPKGWVCYCVMLDKVATTNRVWLVPTTVINTIYQNKRFSFVLIS